MSPHGRTGGVSLEWMQAMRVFHDVEVVPFSEVVLGKLRRRDSTHRGVNITKQNFGLVQPSVCMGNVMHVLWIRAAAGEGQNSGYR